METFFGGALAFLWIIYTIGVMVIYHKIFIVYYFNLGNGLFKEIFFSALIGAFLLGLTFKFFIPLAIILVAIGFLFSRKSETNIGRNATIVLFSVIAIFVFCVGKYFNIQ